ncbi:hypothetical protein [Nocardiopsis sp. CC223A]|uniref:hypothetical protein n=1 Tax=Nocardiopsis sp. CC223A TaxID=3044051 RepID=UPI00278BCF25|nr:hypothetical protein [Nocardiopsis sp. CC223A]
MTMARWIGVVVAAVAIVAALAAGLWFGGGPTSREGWEAAAWAGTIAVALSLIANAIVWASTSTKPSLTKSPDAPVGTDNTVNGNVSGGTVTQGRDMHVNSPSYGGNHNDFRGGTFNESFINEQHNHRSGPEENTEPDQ